MVRNQKIIRLAERMEHDRQQRELRKQGIAPPKDEDEPEPSCCCDAEPQLPNGWKRHWSGLHQLHYFHHSATQTTTWRWPREVPPAETAQQAHAGLQPVPAQISVQVMDDGTNKNKARPPPPPSEPPTSKDKLRGMCDEMLFMLGICICWGTAAHV